MSKDPSCSGWPRGTVPSWQARRLQAWVTGWSCGMASSRYSVKRLKWLKRQNNFGCSFVDDWSWNMTNINALEGIRCPKCGNEGHFYIAGSAMFSVFDDGVGEYFDTEWDGGSYCRCANCGHEGILENFGYA